MILAQITDTHILQPDAADPEEAARAGVRATALQQVVADINALRPRPDAVIHTGDLTHTGSAGQFALAREILDDLSVPYFVTAGNRDGRTGFARAFADKGYVFADGAFVSYAVDDFAVRLISVDSLCPDSNKGDFCEARLAGLDRLLAMEKTRPTALFLHHPPFMIVKSAFPLSYERHEAFSELATVLRCHPQVRRVFAGHAHRAASDEIGGVPASTAPAIAIDLRMGDYPDAMLDKPIYQLHRFDARDGFVTETRLVA